MYAQNKTCVKCAPGEHQPYAHTIHECEACPTLSHMPDEGAGHCVECEWPECVQRLHTCHRVSGAAETFDTFAIGQRRCRTAEPSDPCDAHVYCSPASGACPETTRFDMLVTELALPPTNAQHSVLVPRTDYFGVAVPPLTATCGYKRVTAPRYQYLFTRCTDGSCSAQCLPLLQASEGGVTLADAQSRAAQVGQTVLQLSNITAEPRYTVDLGADLTAGTDVIVAHVWTYEPVTRKPGYARPTAAASGGVSSPPPPPPSGLVGALGPAYVAYPLCLAAARFDASAPTGGAIYCSSCAGWDAVTSSYHPFAPSQHTLALGFRSWLDPELPLTGMHRGSLAVALFIQSDPTSFDGDDAMGPDLTTGVASWLPAGLCAAAAERLTPRHAQPCTHSRAACHRSPFARARSTSSWTPHVLVCVALTCTCAC